MEFEQYLTQAFTLSEADQTKDKKPKDVLCISSALLMRLFELVHEEIDDDEVIHHMVEKLSELGKDDRVIVMDDYDDIKKVVDEESEDDDSEESSEEETEDDQEDEDVDE